MSWVKYVFCWEKKNFEPIVNSMHTVDHLALVKALIKNIDHSLYYQADNM